MTLAASSMTVELDVSEFSGLFPFYFAWDANFALVDAGPSLRKLCPSVERGRSLDDIFAGRGPEAILTRALAGASAGQFFLFEERNSGRLFGGSLLPASGARPAIMLASPWIAQADQLDDAGLSPDDFGPQDQARHLLDLLRRQREVARDLERQSDAAQTRKLALVASSIDDAVAIAGADMRVEWVNEGFVRLKGWSPEEARGRDLAALFAHPDARPNFSFEDLAQMRVGDVFRREAMTLRRDGAAYWADISIHPLFDERGALASFVAIARDVTERKLSQEALRASRGEALRQRDELAQIYEYAPVGLCFFDRQMRYRRINRWLAGINGLPAEAHIGRRVADILPSLAPAATAVIARVIETGQAAHDLEIVGETPAQPGVARYFTLSSFPAFGEDGAVSGVGCVVEEITQSKRIEAFKEANRRKDEFLATLAHELRNPLTPVKATLQMLQLPGADDPAARAGNLKALQKAERQVDHLLRLVEDLLEVARITLGKIELRKERTDLLDLLPQALDMVAPLMESKGHRLVQDLQATALPVFGDRVRLVQILANLLDNAVKYTPEGGCISLVAKAENGEALLSIRDNGVGIPPEKLEYIFDLFAQVDYCGLRARGGIGIGLALTRHLVQLHGGTVQAISSGLGKGSEFIVRLPLTT